MYKYFIKTYGCQMNIHDSERIAGMLEALGLAPARNLADADLFIINSCSVRQAAEDKVTGLAQHLPQTYLRRQATIHKPLIILTGCWLGSARGERKRIKEEDIKKRVPWVDFFLTTEEVFHKLPNLVKNVEPKGFESKRKPGNHAFIAISSGCNNFCSYCVVPYARGKEVNRDEKEILKEIKNLTKKGFCQFTLLGQNVNSWKNEGFTFAALLKTIHKIPEVEKISFLSANPFDFTKDLVETLALPKIDRYLHLPVQSGNDEILQKMNRRHTATDYIKLVTAIREKVPEIEIGTDVIVGFPGETKNQFMDTVKLFEKLKFSVAYIAMYSERPGTTAAKLYSDSVPLAEKKLRHKILMEVFKANKPKL